MCRATLRFYGELADFLPQRQCRAELSVLDGPSVKDRIEACGVPHTEVDLILANGEPVGFDFQLSAGDRISVYPVFRTLETAFPLRPDPPVGRFVVDVNLGRLANYLRMLGFDAISDGRLHDGDLAEISATDDRILLTKDRNLLKRSLVVHGYFVREIRPRDQIVEVVRRFRMSGLIRPFARCMECNGQIDPVAKAAIDHLLEPLTREHFDEFRQCAECGRVFWQGSHFADLSRLVDEIRNDC